MSGRWGIRGGGLRLGFERGGVVVGLRYWDLGGIRLYDGMKLSRGVL